MSKIEIVQTNLTGKLSLVDHIWNDAMETAAQRCESMVQTLRNMDGDPQDWSRNAASCIQRLAQDMRELKRNCRP